jgi:hypothetical protein
MKGIQGLIIAIGLGVIGGLFNFIYLAQKSRDVERVAFLGIKAGVDLAPGDRIAKEHLATVEVPFNAVGNLKDFAVPAASENAVIGRVVWRAIQGGSLLFENDYKTPPQSLAFGQPDREGVEERAMGVPIDVRKMVTSLVNPGDYVSFVATGGTAGPTFAPSAKADGSRLTPTPASPAGPGLPVGMPGAAGPPSAATHSSDGVELIGPFRVLSLGNRLGSAEVLRSFKTPQVQENVMMILIRVENGKLEPQAARLVKLLETTGDRPLGYLLHPTKTK